MRVLPLVSLLPLTWTKPVLSDSPGSDVDRQAIEATALNYIEGWYQGDPERMKTSLHPELAKRIVRTDPETGERRLEHQEAQTLVNRTRAGMGCQIPEWRRQKRIS